VDNGAEEDRERDGSTVGWLVRVVVKHNMEDLQLSVEDADNRAEWRRRTRVADTSPEGSTA